MGEFWCGRERVCVRASGNCWKVHAAAGYRRGDYWGGGNDGYSQASKCATAFWLLIDRTGNLDC